jgi:hypothetical protein
MPHHYKKWPLEGKKNRTADEGLESGSKTTLRHPHFIDHKLQLTQTPAQKERAATLLLASDSPAAFVRACLIKKRDGELGVVDLYEHYQEWCRENHLRSFPSKPFSRIAKEEIEITWGLKLRHDLPGENGKPRRGWKGLVLVERADCGNLKIESCGSVG